MRLATWRQRKNGCDLLIGSSQPGFMMLHISLSFGASCNPIIRACCGFSDFRVKESNERTGRPSKWRDCCILEARKIKLPCSHVENTIAPGRDNAEKEIPLSDCASPMAAPRSDRRDEFMVNGVHRIRNLKGKHGCPKQQRPSVHY